MEISLEYNRGTAPPQLTKRFLTDVVQQTVCLATAKDLLWRKVTISIAALTMQKIRFVNRRYRGRDCATDIISIGTDFTKRVFRNEEAVDIFLGELLICYPYIRKSATLDNIPIKQECAFVLAHGVLHLMGFRHSKKMFALQDQISAPYAQGKKLT